MGYTTWFEGAFRLDRQLTAEHEHYLAKFAGTRRMKRDAAKTERREDPTRVAAGLPVGADGGYFVGADGAMGQEYGADDVVDGNGPPEGQPGLWCQWVPSEDGTAIVHDGGEKFYYYEEWLAYLLEHFLGPWGYVVNGAVTWQGEESGDRGRLIVQDNAVRVQRAVITYEDVE